MKRKRELEQNCILKTKICIFKGCSYTSISVNGKNPYCREHTNKLCCLRNEKTIFNENRCNSTVKMIEVDGKHYCNAHYRTLITKCNNESCNINRNSNELCFDKKWYCKKHKLSDSLFINKFFSFMQNKLNYDVIHKISKIHLNNNTYKL